MFGVPLHLVAPRDTYQHGWGQECHNPKLIVCTWVLRVQDKNGNTCKLFFDLVNGSSPIVFGLDASRFTNTYNLCHEPTISLQRPQDDVCYTFSTYIAPESPDKPLCLRTRIELLPRPDNTQAQHVTSLLSNLRRTVDRNPRTFAARVHRYTHVHPEQLKEVCKAAGILTDDLASAIDTVDASCNICIQHGRPLPSKKVSLTHVNEAFNEEIQIDFTYAVVYRRSANNPNTYDREKHILLVMTDTGTRYTEATIVTDRSVSTIINAYEKHWLCKHGASKRLSADDEYHRRALTGYLETHGIIFRARPTRRHNKIGIVERKNGTLKDIIRRLAMIHSKTPMNNVVTRATFICNLFSGSQTLSSFELARGYRPSLLGIPSTYVSQEILDAHTHQVATRALQRILRSRTPNTPTPGMFSPGDTVWVWYSTSKQNEDDRWIKATVVRTHQHFMEVRQLKDGRPCKGPTMKPAYEDVRIAPQNDLAQELMQCSLEGSIDTGIHMERGEQDADSTMEAAPQNTVSSLVAGIHKRSATDDIGPYALRMDKQQPDITAELQTDRDRVLDSIYECVGSRQVTRSKLEFAPPWILDYAFDKEYKSNWVGSYIPVEEKDVPHDANIITSHVVYKIKTAEDGTRTLKSRIVPHGNRDDDKDSIRKDSATAQLNIIRLLLSLVTFLGFRLATADIKGAYLQSGPIKRAIYVRPPREWYRRHGSNRRILWKLTKLPYGIVEAGRQWQKTVENWMLSDGGLKRVFGLSQMFIRRNKQDEIVLMVAKVTDDFLVAGKLDYIQEFMDRLKERFTVGKVVIKYRFYFNGCEIQQSPNGDIRMSMTRYLDRLRPISVSRSRRKQREMHANDDETKLYRALAGTLLYLGNGVMPQASLVVSLMQQRIGNLTVQNLIDANEMLRDLLKLKPWITFRRPTNTESVTYCTFSDASHPNNCDYGQTGIFAGLRITSKTHGRTIFHPIDWTSHKQHRVSYSSYGAEILAAATADDRGFYFKDSINRLFPHVLTKHELFLDSKCLFDTITTLHESHEYRLRPTVQRIRNSFESNELERMRWIPGRINVADALTKRSTALIMILNDICSSGYVDIDLDAGYSIDSAAWQ